MKNKDTALRVSGIVFLFIAIMHSIRLLLKIKVTVANFSVPLWFSVFGFIFPLVLSCWIFSLCKEYNGNNKDEKTVKRKIGIRLFEVSLILIFSSFFAFNLNNENLHRLFFSIFCAIFALGFRAFLYIPLLKREEDSNKDMDDKSIKNTNIDYLYYSVVLIIFSCVVYLQFFNIIEKLNRPVFYFLFAFLFGALGLAVATLIAILLKSIDKIFS